MSFFRIEERNKENMSDDIVRNKKQSIRNMKLMKSDKCYGVIAAAITMGILLLSISYGQMLGGKYKFIVGDLYTQCAPFANLFVKKIVEGSNLYYSFNAGLGGNTSLLFAFYVFSPFNILYLFSDGSNIDAISIVVFVSKAGMAAFSFWLYSRYNLKVRNFGSVIFSVGYALVSYGIVISEMTALYDGVYLLPFILVAIKYMVDNKKSAWLILLYTMLFASSFYSGYVVGIASFGYFVLYTFVRSNEEKKSRIIIRYFLSVGCAFCLAGFILAPALYEVLKQNAVDGEYIFRTVPVWDMISYLFPFHKRELNQMNPYYYCGIPVALLISGFFANGKILKKYKIAAAITLVIAGLTMSVMPLYSAAHMFNNPNGYTFRYIYIIAFVISSMGAIALGQIGGIRLKAIIIVDMIIVLVSCFVPFINKSVGIHDNSPSSIYIFITLGLVFSWLFILGIYIRCIKQGKLKNIKKLAIISVILISFETCLNSYVILTSEQRYDVGLYEYRTEQAKVLTSEISKYDDSIYRIHYDWLMNPNQACLYDYYGTDFFASSMNLDLQEFLYRIGLQSETYYLTNNGNTDLMKFLLDVKYNLHAYVQYEEGNINYIDENPTAGFGFMVGEEVTDVELGDSVFENQNAVYSALLGENVSPYASYMGGVTLTGENVDIYMEDDGGTYIVLRDGADIGYVSVRAADTDIDEGEIYAWLSAGVNLVTPVSPIITSLDVQEGCGYVERLLSTPHIVQMSRGDGCYEVQILFARGIVDETVIKKGDFAYYDESYISMLQDKLSSQSFNVEQLEDGHVLGNISATQDGICFLSVPYEEGWVACVDGEDKDIIPLFGNAFIGVPVKEGEHEIELRFEAPLSKIGIMFSIIGVVVFAAIAVVDYRKGNRKADV